MKRNLKWIIGLIVVAVAIGAGCTDAERAKIGGYGNTYKVTLYSGGKEVREWKSSGKVMSEDRSDGYYFNDAATGKLIEVNGDVVIEQLD